MRGSALATAVGFGRVGCGQCNGNKISQWAEVEHLAGLPVLQTVYLEGNPIAQDARYRARVKLLLPRLTQIDAVLAR